MAPLSETLAAIHRKPGRWTIAGLPEGADSLALAELARTTGGQDILHVARDGQRLERLQDGLRFFAPEREVLVFPAWDCLPYDRLSPHPDIVAERLETLVRLAAPKKPGAPARIVLASVGAALQRVPPRSLYAEAAVVLRKGQTARRRLADEVPGRERLWPLRDRDGAGRVRRARRPGRSLPARHVRAAAARPVRRHAGGDPLVRRHEPALDRRRATRSCCCRSARCC